MQLNILRLPIIIQRTGISRSSIYAMMTKGEFPKPIKIGIRSVGWLENEIDNWIEENAKRRPD